MRKKKQRNSCVRSQLQSIRTNDNTDVFRVKTWHMKMNKNNVEERERAK